jgi:protein-S-isoprenylcysteine O-methyltransferase Ste14
LACRFTPALRLEFPGTNAAAIVFVLTGILIAALGVMSFRRARTTVNPMKPESSTALVVRGIYRVTRNPMYLGFLFVLGGFALFLRHPVAFLALPLFVLYMNRFQIEPEEAALRSRFGAEFTDYQSRVRRWL